MENNGRELPASVTDAIRRGKKLEAIKRLRLEWRVDLKTAKEIVDSASSDVRRSRKTASEASVGRSAVVEDSGSRRLVTFLLLFGLIAVAVYFMLGL